MATVLGEIAAAASAHATELSELECESYEQRERAVRRDGVWRLRIVAPPAYPVARLGTFVAAAPLAVPIAYPLLGVALHASARAPCRPSPRTTAPTGRWPTCASASPRETGGSGRVVMHAMPDAAREAVDAWGPPPPSFALMRALKDRFDPHGLCNPGRFVGGL